MKAEKYAFEHQSIIRLQFCRWDMSLSSIVDDDVSRLSELADLIGGSFDEAIDYLDSLELLIDHQVTP